MASVSETIKNEKRYALRFKFLENNTNFPQTRGEMLLSRIPDRSAKRFQRFMGFRNRSRLLHRECRQRCERFSDFGRHEVFASRNRDAPTNIMGGSSAPVAVPGFPPFQRLWKTPRIAEEFIPLLGALHPTVRRGGKSTCNISRYAVWSLCTTYRRRQAPCLRDRPSDS